MFPGKLKFQHDVVIFDPLMILLTGLLGILPLSLISVLSQSDALTMGKMNTIMIMGVSGLVMAMLLSFLKQQKFKWIGFEFLFSKGMFLLVLALLGATYLSQFLISGATTVRFGIVDVLQAKLAYGAIGVFEENWFGVFLYLSVSNLVDNKYFTAFNFILNPILFSMYHIYVIGTSIALLYVIVPRIIWNLVYTVWAVPSPIMLTHWTWNYLLASMSVTAMSVFAFSPSLIMMLASPSLAGPLTLTLNCLPAIGLLAYRAVKSR